MSAVIFDVPEDFAVENVVGQGAYGAVCKATWDGVEIALKKIPGYGKSADTARKVLREVEILQHFQYCQQVIACHAVFRPRSGDKDIYLAMDYVGSDLSATMKKGVKMDEDVVRYITCQLLLGMRAMHHYGCIHRDLSCRNILIDENSRISICDFGLSRFYDPEEQLSFGVVTQWYRAPEIITDARYGTKADIFSIGVILGEMLLQKHLFPGKPNDPADQLNHVFSVLGTPTLDLFDDKDKPYYTSSDNAKQYVNMFVRRRPQRNRVRQLPFKLAHDPTAVDVLEALLDFNPVTRPSADEALKMPWFDALRDYISQEITVQDEFHQENAKLDMTNLPPNTKADEVMRAVEEKVPMYNAEISASWKAENQEAQEPEAEDEGGE